MVDQTLVSILSILFSFLGVSAVFILFRSYQVDNFREKVFALREEVFLYAFDQGLLDDRSHKNFRNLLNSLLRYAHKITFPNMVTLLLVKKFLKISFDHETLARTEWETAVAKLSDRQQQKFNQFNKRAMGLVIKHIIYRSVFFWFFAIFAVTPRIIRGQLAASKSIISGAIGSLVPVRLFEAEALRTSRASS